jgi:5-methyltetrahydrofolate corrinoid/iron sulfur protein methyltransferase
MDSVLIAMCIACGLSSAIVNPCSPRMMETIKSADIIMNQTLYADSYLDL